MDTMNNDTAPHPAALPEDVYEGKTYKHRFTGKRYQSGRQGYGNPTYDVERHVDQITVTGKPIWKTIGTVTRQHEARHPGDVASWVAQSSDGTVSAVGTTREEVARSLEYRLLGREYAERKHAEYLAREQAKQDARHRENQALVERLYVLVERFPYLEPALGKAIDKAASGYGTNALFSAEDLALILESVRLDEGMKEQQS